MKNGFRNAIKIIVGVPAAYLGVNIAFGGVEAVRTATEPCGSFTTPLTIEVADAFFPPDRDGKRNRLALIPEALIIMGSQMGDGIGEAMRGCIAQPKGSAPPPSPR